jgi:hypothetical protein
MTISHPQPIEEIREAAARDGADLAVITGLARWAACPECWAAPDKPCRTEGTHLARVTRARGYGLITEAQLGLVLHEVGVFNASTVIPDGAR